MSTYTFDRLGLTFKPVDVGVEGYSVKFNDGHIGLVYRTKAIAENEWFTTFQSHRYGSFPSRDHAVIELLKAIISKQTGITVKLSRIPDKPTTTTTTTKSEIKHKLNVGDILYTSWGYDQTNVEFFQVTKLVGLHTVELREIAQTRTDITWAQEDCLPVRDKFLPKKETLRRRISKYNSTSVKIDDVRRANLWTENKKIRATSYA